MTRDKNTWEQAKTAYPASIGLRELARNMDIPEGTMRARGNRAGWTQQIAAAKVAARPELARELAQPDAINAAWRDPEGNPRDRKVRSNGPTELRPE